MERQAASDCVRTVRANVRQATRMCGAADTAGLRRAIGLLEAAAAEMRRAEADARRGMPGDAAELRRETALLKREIACMMRVIDGCAALGRGLSLRLSGAALGYTCQGRTILATSAAACEMQG
jgi:hypothetical protein